jgi:hypothetical protein
VTGLRGSKELLFASCVALLDAGGGARVLAAETLASVLWFGDPAVGLVVSAVWTVGAIQRRQPSVDVIAVLALPSIAT